MKKNNRLIMKPHKILFWKKRVMTVVTVSTLVLLTIGVWFALFESPVDYQQGDFVRIMYVHVPASWMALGVYAFIAFFSFLNLIFRLPMADLTAKAAAPIGAGFTILSLITGSLWGKPMWGAWWVWDARLTSVLILLFLYFGYMTLTQTYDNKTQGLKAANVLAIIGIINLPIIKFSVEWWNTLHQPASVLRFAKPAIDSSMLIPLFIMAAGYASFFIMLLLIRLEGELLDAKVNAVLYRLHKRGLHG